MSYLGQPLFKKCFPIAQWGKIDWEKIDHKIDVGYDPQDIMPALEKLIGRTVDTKVYVEWSTMGLPIIQTDIKRVIGVFDDVTCVAFEKFIFNLNQGYVIEVLPSYQITIGIVPGCAERYGQK